MAKMRDYFFSDLSIFFNVDEFAPGVDINGKSIDIVKDDDELKRFNLKQGGEGLAQGEILFYAKKSDFQEELFIKDVMRFNKKTYRILDVKEIEGIYSVILVGLQS